MMPERPTFQLFSALHGYAVLGGIAFVIGIYFLAKTLNNPVEKRRDAKLYILLIIAIYLLLTITKVVQKEWSMAWNLPLHLCDISAWVLGYALYSRNQTAFQLGYYWGAAGALFGFGTPSIQFVDWYMIPFFFWHALLLAAPVYLMVTEGFRPSHKGVFLAWIWVCLIGVVLLGVNYFLGGNYMYVSQRIPPMEMMGLPEWPTYLVYLIPLMLVLFYLFWLPFAKRPVPTVR
ncbi:MAG: hypothetical protein RLZZ292_1725 [Bacteroidota bacterium]|jgi:hypothetical integral membrane protein (TIGR02206 family)